MRNYRFSNDMRMPSRWETIRRMLGGQFADPTSWLWIIFQVALQTKIYSGIYLLWAAAVMLNSKK
jgi:hypothetical protein